MLTASRYQTKPQPLEAALVTEHNFADVHEWMLKLSEHASTLRRLGSIPSASGVFLPTWSGVASVPTGAYVVYLGGGRFIWCSAEDFAERFDPAPEPADPSLCSCLNPQGHGLAEGDGPMVWDPDCKVCGRPLTPEALASLIGEVDA
ncbi:hypothetical protein OIE13_22475 [Streptosporangium sp. NBC_01810]|uniref:hypothetical protein n=1 Tax=Streptosporangium sp. NBC_01810 TaxID=2975951 RepID=UPI002DDC3540|nr:hypothetical protein [Streptosporangium sp. NBC_01810]WSA23710.1 hypothetical protein OIE13_22475 [Streptosporangium sp. NBC_01810]